MSAFKVVILSARAGNLVPCVRAVLDAEPLLAPRDVIVVDDGARAEAERLLPEVTWVEGAKPFVFARNANLGIRAAAPADVLLLNDDATVVTAGGVSAMAAKLRARPDIGLCSAAVRGVVGNARQMPGGDAGLRAEAETLAFVAIYIPRRAYDGVGALDERFVGYGFEDNDYCTRTRAAGLSLAIADCCIVDHSGHLPSTFRTRDDLPQLFEVNRQLYEQQPLPASAPILAREPIRTSAAARGREGVSLMYLACNRLEFTQETFTTLLSTTDWKLVDELHVYDDGSCDGTREWLERRVAEAPCRARFVRSAYGSPVDAMSHFIEHAGSPMLAKVDNDAMMPPGWLGQSLSVFERHPELDLLGIEAMYPFDGNAGVERRYVPAEFISGLGLYRARVFRGSRPSSFMKWFGLEEWQQSFGQELIRGWISPALEVFLLDRCPFEPWTSLTESYIGRDWMRRWPKYDLKCPIWQWRWQPERASAA